MTSAFADLDGDVHPSLPCSVGMIGETVGNFQVVQRLGEGGMGSVLLAQHKDIQTKVAIKVLHAHISADKQHVQRFFNEAVAVSKIKHAGITKIFDVGFHTRGEAYLVMELLEGESLASRIARAGRLPIDHAADIARQIASVLEATHAAGITHRDLKPDNVFLVPDAELAGGERVKVLDFGIAKLGASGMTNAAGMMGTPTYMPPEQWRSTATVDGRADLYALGCLVFEMVCGRPPFVSTSMPELCNMHLNEAPPPLAADVPPAFAELVTRLIAKQPDARPSVSEAKATFGRYAGGVAPTLPPGTSSSVLPSPTTLGRSAMQLAIAPPRRRWPWVVGLAVAAGGVALAVVLSRAPEAQLAVAPPPPPIVVTAPAPVVTAQPSPEAPASRVRIETSPASATIAIDGAAVANPFDGKFARADVRRRLDVSAPGHKPVSRWLVFDGDQTLVITLEKVTKRPQRPVVEPPVVAPVVKPPPEPEPSTGYKGTKAKIDTEYQKDPP